MTILVTDSTNVRVSQVLSRRISALRGDIPLCQVFSERDIRELGLTNEVAKRALLKRYEECKVQFENEPNM